MKTKTKRGKKGVSPLVATVLLVGFTVSLVALTVLWSRGYIEERAEKEEKLASAKIGCESIKFDVIEVSQGTESLEIEITNEASKRIDGFVFRINGDVTEAVEWRQPIDGLATKKMVLGTEDYDVTKVGTINTVGIIPLIKAGKGHYVPCSNQLLEARAAYF